MLFMRGNQTRLDEVTIKLIPTRLTFPLSLSSTLPYFLFYCDFGCSSYGRCAGLSLLSIFTLYLSHSPGLLWIGWKIISDHDQGGCIGEEYLILASWDQNQKKTYKRVAQIRKLSELSPLSRERQYYPSLNLNPNSVHVLSLQGISLEDSIWFPSQVYDYLNW